MSDKRIPTESDLDTIKTIALRRSVERSARLVELQVQQYERVLLSAFERGESSRLVDLRPADIETLSTLPSLIVAEGDSLQGPGFHSESIVQPLLDKEFGRIQVVAVLDNEARTKVQLNVRAVTVRGLKKPCLAKADDGTVTVVPITQSDVIIATEWGHRPKDGFPGITVREQGGALSVLWFRAPDGTLYIGLQKAKRGTTVSTQNPDGTMYECPRGFAEPDETREQTALRELQEEQPDLDVAVLLKRAHGLHAFTVSGLNANTAMFNYPEDANGVMKGVDFVIRELPFEGFVRASNGSYAAVVDRKKTRLVMDKDELGKISKLVFYPLTEAQSLSRCLMTRAAIAEAALVAASLASAPSSTPSQLVSERKKGEGSSDPEYSLKRALTLFNPVRHAGIQGWKSVPVPSVDIRVNPKAWALAWVAVPMKMKESVKIDDVDRPLFKPGYDQPVIIEDLGVIIIATDRQGRVALIDNYRFITDRLPGVQVAGYVKTIQETGRWEELIASAGRVSLECPRGILNAENLPANIMDLAAGADVSAFVKHAAKVEGLEEGGLEFEDLTFMGWMNWNTTFSLHPQAVVHARVKSVGRQQPEELEHIGALHLLSPKELRERITAGSFIDGITLAALSLCGIHIPPASQG